MRTKEGDECTCVLFPRTEHRRIYAEDRKIWRAVSQEKAHGRNQQNNREREILSDNIKTSHQNLESCDFRNNLILRVCLQRTERL